jgi:hypothetical protein
VPVTFRGGRRGGGRRPVEQGDAMQRQIEHLLRSFGFEVFVIGTRQSRGTGCPNCGTFVPTRSHGTRQTPGVTDLIGFSKLHARPLDERLRAAGAVLPLRRVFVFVESKCGPHARLNPEQQAFRALCKEAGIPHVVGDLNAVIAWLCEQGIARPDQFSHFRQPKQEAAVE